MRKYELLPLLERFDLGRIIGVRAQDGNLLLETRILALQFASALERLRGI